MDSGVTIMDYIDSYIYTNNKKIYVFTTFENNYIDTSKEFKNFINCKHTKAVIKELKIYNYFKLG